MKEKILKFLRESKNEYISGEVLCQKFNVSRTAIWKHVKDLQKEGYQIDAVRNKGYRLISIPDLVTASEIREGLNTSCMGQQIVDLKMIDSTNIYAAKLADEGEPEGTLVIADQQLGGKGRRGRQWFSPSGTGVWMSLILRPNLPIHLAPQLTLVAAVAVSQALTELTGQKAGIKWPNDILFGDRKCVGILTEMNMESEFVTHVILGIGINVNQTEQDFPDELQNIATSLRLLTGLEIKRALVVQRVLEKFEKLYHKYVSDQNFSSIRELWKEGSITIGRTITAQTPGHMITGVAQDIDEMGALIIENNTGRHKVYSADINLS